MVDLEIYNINNVQAEGFMDHVITRKAPTFLGFQETRIETEAMVSLKDDQVSLIRPIQEIFFPKYKLQFIVDAEYWVEQMRYARKILVKQDNETNHDAVVIEFTRELLANDAYRVDMTYYDRADGSVVEYFKSSWLEGVTQDIELFEFHYSDTAKIYTRLEPIPSSPDAAQETYDNSDKLVLTKSLLKETDTYTFYLSKADVKALQRGMHHYSCSISGVGPQAEVLPAPRITPISGSDIYRVDIDFIYNIQTIYT